MQNFDQEVDMDADEQAQTEDKEEKQDAKEEEEEEADGHFEEDSEAEDVAAALKPPAESDPLKTLQPTPSPVKNFPDALSPSLPELSADVLLCASLDGQISLYDRRAKEAAMRKFDFTKDTPPWAMQVRIMGLFL